MDKQELKPCPHCKTSWLFVSDGDYYSGYESYGFRVNCQCGYAWEAIQWQPTEDKAIEEWNRRVQND